MYCLRAYDDGSGPALYAGGSFESIAGSPASRMAKWDGTGWSPIGAPIDGTSNSIYALTVADDGAGVRLFVGGEFGDHDVARVGRQSGRHDQGSASVPRAASRDEHRPTARPLDPSHVPLGGGTRSGDLARGARRHPRRVAASDPG